MIIKNAVLITFSLAFLCQNGMTQEKAFSFPDEYTIAASDPLGHFYLVNEDQLIKSGKKGDYLFTFSDPGLGNITWIDPSDPFRILVYYRSFNQLVFLDRTLSPIADPVSLDETDIFSPAGICRSSQGGVWLIDEINSSIVKLNSKLEKTVNTRFSGISTGSNNRWLPMIEWKERLYICIPDSTIIQYDLFGTRIKNIPARAESFGFSGLSLLFTGSHGAYSYTGFGIPEGPEKLIDLDYENLIISGDIGLAKDKKGWQLYHLKKTF